MHETTLTALSAVQAILAPAIGISAVGLLLLGLNTRYSAIINRIRLLNDEKRRFTRQLSEQKDLSFIDNARLMSIGKQSERLLVRCRLVRNAILSMQTAIGLFVLTSVLIGVSLFAHADAFGVIPLVTFLLGLVIVFVGVIYSATEVYRSFAIVLIEMKAEE